MNKLTDAQVWERHAAHENTVGNLLLHLSGNARQWVIGGVGGPPMPLPLLKVWEARGVALQQGYGMTETSPAVLTLDREDAARDAGSCGKPLVRT